MNNNNMLLENNSKIAIIGGGPAGSFFAHFASKYAEERGINVSIKIFDRKSFCQRGPRGCNMCAGVISESLFNKLNAEGINLAQSCVQRDIESYCFKTHDDGVQLWHPQIGHKPKIITVFRGNGPVQSSHKGNISFDDFILNHVRSLGVELIFEIVKEVIPSLVKGEPVSVIYGEGDGRREYKADLVVGTFGVNTGMMEKIGNMNFGYKPPRTVRTCQCEIMLDKEYIDKAFGNNVFVFALGNKEIKFASIAPKADYITVNLVGRTDLTRRNLIEFLNHSAVKRLMPKGWEVPEDFCMCISKIPVTHAKHPFTDRIVIIGDASISRTYKNGIESAFNMAELSARSAFRHGVSDKAFMKGYFRPAKRMLAKDNLYGILMLKLNDYISSQRQMANAHIKIIKSGRDNEFSNWANEILWNMLTGNATYREIFSKAMNPRFVLRMLPIDANAWIRQKGADFNNWLRRN